MITELEMINAMLAVNGEAPVSSASSTDPAAIQARNALTRIDKQLQARGWYYNTETMTLSPLLSTGEVILPSNTLSVDPVDVSSPYVQRGTKLYDRTNNTFNLAVTVKVNIVLRLDIVELPVLAGTYLQDKAVKDFYVDEDGDEGKTNRLENRESESFAYLQREHLANSNVNIRNSNLGRRLMQDAYSQSTSTFGVE
jgi:hypothetical protein